MTNFEVCLQIDPVSYKWGFVNKLSWLEAYAGTPSIAENNNTGLLADYIWSISYMFLFLVQVHFNYRSRSVCYALCML